MSKKLTLDLILSQSTKNNSNLISLNVCGNNINDISLLAQYPSLEVISLSNNNIKDLTVFKNLKNLKKLNLKDNKISDFNQIESLKNCKQLESLSLKDNPISKEQNYQKRIREILPQLKRLDDIELNKIINKEIKISMKNDSKKIDKLNMITSKLIKFKNTKTKNSQSPFKQKVFSGSPMRQQKIKNINNIDNNINILNSSGKKNVKENKSLNNSNKKNELNNKSIDITNDNSAKKNSGKNNVNHNQNQNQNEEDLFENININAEKKKLEIEDKDNEQINNKSKKNVELLSYSFKKKKTSGYFYRFKKKTSDNNNAEVNSTLDNIKIDNQLINTFNDENKNINYNLNNSRYSRKIIGKFPGTHNILSQSIRYDDDNDDENNNDLRFSQKSKLGSIKNRLFNKITNQIMNSNKINNNEVDDEKIIIKSIKLLLGNLGKEELEQINKDLVNAISKVNK